jgi:hypothetical protein
MKGRGGIGITVDFEQMIMKRWVTDNFNWGLAAGYDGTQFQIPISSEYVVIKKDNGRLRFSIKIGALNFSMD